MITQRTTRTRSSVAALALSAALLLTLAADTSADDLGLLVPGGAGTSGTLPINSGTGGIPISPFFAPWGPAVYKPAKPATSLTGLATELDDVIVSAYSPNGTGWFHVSPTAPGGTLTITYHGDFVLEIDRQAFLASQVTANLSVAPSFNGGVAAVKSAGMRRTTQVLRTGSQSLQLHRMIHSELAQRGITVRLFDKSRERTAQLEILDEGGRVRIEQDH